MRIVRVLTAFIAAASVACSDGMPTQPPSGAPELEGIILGVDMSAMSIRIELDNAPASNSAFERQAKIGFTSDMPLVVRDRSGKLKAAELTDIRVGAHVRAWVGDAMLKSLPPQYMGEFFEIQPD